MTTRPHCWQCGAEQMPDLEADNRARPYRARVRLYDLTKSKDIPEADSDPELDAMDSGTEICAGLSGVAEYVVQLANLYHGGAGLPGMERALLEDKIPGFRPTLSRNKGKATWRLPYDTPRTFSTGPLHKPGWVARVDVERADHVAEVAPTAYKLRRAP